MRGYNREYFKGWSLIGRLVRDEGRSFSGREAHCCFLNSGGERFGFLVIAAVVILRGSEEAEQVLV